jgi:alkylation response protein AidB-like acyl-CoA dehydrogenase
MDQPEISVREIKQMNGHNSFFEVAMRDAVIPADHLVGREGNGWAVVRTALFHERQADSSELAAVATGWDGRTAREAELEAQNDNAPYVWYPQRTGRPDIVVEVARKAGVQNDPVVRDELARIEALTRVERWTRLRSASSPELAPVTKLLRSDIARRCSRLLGQICGPAAIAGEATTVVREVILSVPAVSLAGGTDEMQRNWISERWLGMPR